MFTALNNDKERAYYNFGEFIDKALVLSSVEVLGRTESVFQVGLIKSAVLSPSD